MKLPLFIAVCAGLVLSGAAQSGEMIINQRFSGVGHPTMVDTDGDGVFAGASSFQLKGNPGKATMLALAEFTDFAFVGIPGCDLRAELVQESFVETFSDGSMLFFEATSGFNCVNLATFEIGGQLSGIITGGTGRFEGATGSWIIPEFEAFLVGQTQNALTGTFKGTIDVPD